jgi:hypothetical protein
MRPHRAAHSETPPFGGASCQENRLVLAVEALLTRLIGVLLLLLTRLVLAALIRARIALLLLARLVGVVLILVRICHCGVFLLKAPPEDQRAGAHNVPQRMRFHNGTAILQEPDAGPRCTNVS